MDALVLLSREPDAHRISLEEYREQIVAAVDAASADELLSLALFFADAELDDEMCDMHELTKR